MRATLTDCPPLLETDIDTHRYKISQDEGFYRLGRKLDRDSHKVRRAWQHAGEVDSTFRARMVGAKLTYLEALASFYPDSWEAPTSAYPTSRLTIAVVGHPYCLYDDYINHNILGRLRDVRRARGDERNGFAGRRANWDSTNDRANALVLRKLDVRRGGTLFTRSRNLWLDCGARVYVRS